MALVLGADDQHLVQFLLAYYIDETKNSIPTSPAFLYFCKFNMWNSLLYSLPNDIWKSESNFNSALTFLRSNHRNIQNGGSKDQTLRAENTGSG